ncbi:MAG: AMP-binding protein, partial [Sciscionella sp.]
MAGTAGEAAGEPAESGQQRRQPHTVADLLTAAVRRGGEHPALIEGATGRTISWADTERLAAAIARRLVGAEMRAGDRVLLRLPNGIAWCVALFGVLRAGGVAVPVAVDAPRRVLDHVLTDSGATLVVGEEPAVDDGTPGTGTGDSPANGPFAFRGHPYEQRYISVPTEIRADPAGGDTGAVETDVDATVASAVVTGLSSSDGSVGGEDLAVLYYTSGTSGVQRGVMLSHRALLANVAQCVDMRPAPVTAADTVFLALPLYHLYGLGPGLLQAAASGATVLLVERFDPAGALRLIERHRVTTVVGVPSMYSALLTLGEQRLRTGMATVRLLTSGAAPLEPALLERIDAATGLRVFEGYGLTETAPVLTSTMITGRTKPGSVGRPLPGVELRLVDSDGSALSEPDETGDERGGTGLVSVRGPNLFSGYWPDGAHGPDAGGWFRTGDIGYLDADGDLHLVDRVEDLIIVNGFNVYPHEVEDVLGELDGVAEAA